MVPAILMSLTRHCCVNITNQWCLVISEEGEVFIKVLHQERVMAQKSLSKSSGTKTGICRL